MRQKQSVRQLTLLSPTGFTFVYVNISDIAFALRACFFVIGVVEADCMFFCFGLNLCKIKSVHIKLQNIIHGTVTSNLATSKKKLMNQFSFPFLI